MWKPIVLSMLFTTWIWYTGYVTWQMYSKTQLSPAAAFGFSDVQKQWAPIKVDVTGSVVCQK